MIGEKSVRVCVWIMRECASAWLRECDDYTET